MPLIPYSVFRTCAKSDVYLYAVWGRSRSDPDSVAIMQSAKCSEKVQRGKPWSLGITAFQSHTGQSIFAHMFISMTTRFRLPPTAQSCRDRVQRGSYVWCACAIDRSELIRCSTLVLLNSCMARWLASQYFPSLFRLLAAPCAHTGQSSHWKEAPPSDERGGP